MSVDVDNFRSGDEDSIREQYEKILSHRHEGILVDIGNCAYSHIMAEGIKAGLLATPGPIDPAKEIHDVLRLMGRRPQPRCGSRSSDARDGIWFRDIWRELRGADELFRRRCVELPKLFETLQIHRNKKAHRKLEVTVASLCALCGTVLMVLELASDGWIDQKSIASLRSAAENGLKKAAQQILVDVNYGDQIDRGEIDRLRDELEEVRGKLKESRRTSHTAFEIDGRLQNFQNEIMNNIDVKMDQQNDTIHDALIALRDELVTDSRHHHPVEEDEEYDNEIIDSIIKLQPLTREMARRKLNEGSKRITAKLGISYPANIFQEWIVDAALDKAATDGLNKIDDWWALPIVQKKKGKYEKMMKQQLQLSGCEDWMMDIYRRVEKRLNSRT